MEKGFEGHDLCVGTDPALQREMETKEMFINIYERSLQCESELKL